ncbi:MAG: glycerate dehydrogenase [Nitrosomonas sp.]|nr:MAG: glycerate dehydrogenase [Nitrosomonas sp.]
MRAIFLDFGSVTRGDMDCTTLERAVSPWRFYHNSIEADVSGRIGQAEIVVSNKVYIGREAIRAAKHLRLICVAATGYNNVDLTAAAAHGIPVCNVRGYATPSVAQHVLMLMLNLARHFMDYQQLVRRGGWQAGTFFCPLDFGIQELSGKKLGVIGYGELGKAVAQLAQAFGMQILVAEHKNKPPRPGRIAFDDMLRTADFITLHCPLSPETGELITHREFGLMKASAYLINTARGGLINEADLLACLSDKRIAGAAIDVIQDEPPGKDNLILRRQPEN